MRSRLLAVIAGMAALVLLVFGIVAYRLVDDAKLDHETEILQASVEQLARDLEHVAPDVLGEEIARVFPRAARPRSESVLVVTGPGGSPMIYTQSASPAAIALRDTVLEKLEAGATRGRGYFSLGDDAFVWAASHNAPGRHRVIRARLATVSTESTFESLGVRMLVTGLVVMWIAMWGGLIVTTSIARRLDQQNAELERLARHDDLTGLPNRALLRDRLERLIELGNDNQTGFSLLVIDLDRFKEINDTLGHHYGDDLLVQVGQRMVDTLRSADTVARMGGDEFAVLLPNTDVDAATACTAKLIGAMQHPFQVKDCELETALSVGIATYPNHGCDPEKLAQYADVAMYHAKRTRTGFAIYSSEIDSHSLVKLMLTSELRGAAETGQFMLHYQPKLDLRTGQFSGAEALIRWNHPERGLIFPDGFIEVAEQNGIIPVITDWVLNEALRQCREWLNEGIECCVAVNLSAYDLHDTLLPDRLAKQLAEHAVPARLLELELTETAAMADIARAATLFARITELGVSIAIDDFGTGMSSLAYLKGLPVNYIKIDRSFVTDMASDEENRVIVRSVIDLSHSMHRAVIAEGVEDESTLRDLREMGCDIAQGYCIGRPMPAEALREMLTAGATPDLTTTPLVIER